MAWPITLIGLGVATFAVVGLSGPGRIDIVDGQTRFEVGRSLVEHGDSILRDERIWWRRFTGHSGHPYSDYRFPHSVMAAGAILAADASGPVSEERRAFFFTFCGAVACGVLSIVYAIWFRYRGCRPTAALGWGAAGFFCTPMWCYGASTFDEFLGTTLLIAALVAAAVSRERASLAGAIAAGLLLGLAYNCTQALTSFGVLAVALHDDTRRPGRERFLHAALIAMGLLAGVAAEMGYHKVKFPNGLGEPHEVVEMIYGSNDGHHQVQAVAALSVSIGTGAIWYFPPIVLALVGLVSRWRDEQRVVAALVLASIAFLGFCLSLSHFKGDPCWGPRLLTPLFAVLWLFAPAGAARMRRSLVAPLLSLGVIVQLLGLSVDPHRLFVERDVTPAFGRIQPERHFETALSHLWNRPREIIAIARNTQPAEEYTPAPTPTFGFPVLDALGPAEPGEVFPDFVENTRHRQRLEKRGPEIVERYHVLNSYRPWWSSMTFLPPDDRPVNLGKTAGVLLACLGIGLLLLGFAVRPLGTQRTQGT